LKRNINASVSQFRLCEFSLPEIGRVRCAHIRIAWHN
jgi:hypothetical protein